MPQLRPGNHRKIAGVWPHVARITDAVARSAIRGANPATPIGGQTIARGAGWYAGAAISTKTATPVGEPASARAAHRYAAGTSPATPIRTAAGCPCALGNAPRFRRSALLDRVGIHGKPAVFDRAALAHTAHTSSRRRLERPFVIAVVVAGRSHGQQRPSEQYRKTGASHTWSLCAFGSEHTSPRAARFCKRSLAHGSIRNLRP